MNQLWRNTRVQAFGLFCSRFELRRIFAYSLTVKPGLFALLAFLLFTATIAFGQQEHNAEAEAHANRGLDFAKKGDLGQAEEELRRAVELAPHEEGFLADLGTILAMEKKFDESSKFLEQAVRIDSHDITAQRYLAANLWQLQRFPEAKQHLEILLQQKPGDEQGLLLLGMVAENMKDYATAAKALASVPALVRERPESIAALARSYYHLSEGVKARDVLSQLTPQTPGPQGVFLGAQIADQMGDHATAEKMLSEVESTFPDSVKLYYTLALVQYHAKQFENAKTTLTLLIDSGHKTAEIYNLLAWCDEELHEPDDSRSAMEQAILLEPTNESHSLDLVKILLAQRRYSAALDVAKRTADAFPLSARAFSLKGDVELASEQYTDSISSYGEAVKLDASNPEGLLGLAAAQSADSMNSEASATLEKGRKQFPKDARFPLERGLLLIKSESEDPFAQSRAERMFRLALTLDTSLTEAHYQLGNLALNKGHVAEAVSQLQAAVRLSPDEAKIHFALSRAYRRLNRDQDAAAELALFEKLKSAEGPPVPTSSLGGTPRN